MQPCLRDTFPRRSFFLCNFLSLFVWDLMIKPSKQSYAQCSCLMESKKGQECFIKPKFKMYLHLTGSNPISLTNKRQMCPGQGQFLLQLQQRLAKSCFLCRTSVPCSSSHLHALLQQLRTLRGRWQALCTSLLRRSTYMDSLIQQYRWTSTPAQGSLQDWGQSNSQVYHVLQSASIIHPSLSPEQGLGVRWNQKEENQIKHPE